MQKLFKMDNNGYQWSFGAGKIIELQDLGHVGNTIIVLAMFFWVFPAMNLSSHKNFCTVAMIIAVSVRPPFLDHPLPLVKTPTELGDVCFTWQL